MVKKLLIFVAVFVTIISVMAVAFFVFAIRYVPEIPEQLLVVNGSKIMVNSIEESEYTKEELSEMGISLEQAKDIIKHPDRYRSVDFTFRLRNNSDWYAVEDIQVEKHLPKEAKKRLVWMEDNLTWGHVHEGENGQLDGLIAIFKLEEGESKMI